ncbi:nucleoside-diphosphate-sugar epimerase [Lutibacter oceani]|uniref:Nucleoside-diphosphate-sugar epimerase n=1 Tax=Lutibacter oceani TaxID=1853311 RepID=A0A3D9RQA8_9FLAO|nr:hypothetical protein [Lutibacter oceani]REE81648.1 nucleoside-diphosphate-sugar epimerase [Lutibacter oceani]
MDKNISILGCGWLGEPLAIKLIEQGCCIKGSTTSSFKLDEFKKLRITPFLISLEDLKETLFEFLRSDILIVALPSKNINGFKNLIKYIEQSSIKKVLFISATSVYKSNNLIVTEESDLYNNAALVEIEKLFKTNKKFKTTVIRFAGLFGYNRKPGNFFKNGRIIPNPEGFVNMIHQDDCVAILTKIIENNIWNEVFNACADSHPKRRDYYIKTKADIGKDAPVFEETEKNVFKIISNKKIKSALNYNFKYADLMAINYGDLDI